MDFNDTQDEAAYRAKLVGWLHQFLADHPERPVPIRTWQRALYDAGYMAQTWPVDEGGQGLSPSYDLILNDEIARAGAPHLPTGPNYLGRTMFRFGTDEQREQFLDATLNGDIQWCQGFSEPGAGSDLASMRTRADFTDGEWVINGQKLWTSGAHEADYCLLLARSEPDAPKHKGISAFLVDMKTPGVTVRPVRTSDGWEHTCETFWDDVRVPANRLVGERGQGWAIAMWALQFERGPADLGITAALQAELHELESVAREVGVETEQARRALARAYVDLRVLDLNAIRQLSHRIVDRPPGADGPVAKILWAVAAQSLGHAWLDALGSYALLGQDDGHAISQYFYSRPASVYGGSEQIQKNLLSQRFMGMPKPGTTAK